MKVVEIVGAANGQSTPHDGEFVVAWNPHTYYGSVDITTTPDRAEARVFDDAVQVVEEWRTVSRVQGVRPTDGKPNRPLTGLTIMIDNVELQHG